MPTNNPVPSQDPSDLLFNAGRLDEVVNGTANSFTDRLGVARRTVAGMNADFDAQLADAESDLNVYRADAAASAAEALGYLQTIRATSYGAYASDPATDPLGNPPTVGDEYFNTTSNLLKRWNGTTWQASDINTANLAASSGSSLVGYDGGTVQDVLDGAKSLQDYAALRAYTGRAKRVYITGPLVTAKPAGISGVFQQDSTDTTSADNGGTIIVGADGRRWKRDFSGSAYLSWFGALSDSASDASAAISLALDAADEIIVDAKYYIKTGLTKTVSRSKKFIGKNNACFVIDNNYGLRINAAIIASSAPTGNIAMFDNGIPLVSAASFKAGDLVYVYSTQSAESQWNYQRRLPFTIKSVASNTITLSNPIEIDYNHATYPVTVENYGNITFEWDGIDFELINGSGSTLRYLGFQNPSVSNVNIDGISAAAIAFGITPYACIGAKTLNISAKNIYYPLVSTYSRNGIFRATTGNNAAHVVDTVMSVNDTFYDVTGIDCSATLGLHPAFNVVVDGVIAINDKGPMGFRTWGGALRNVRHRFADTVTTGVGGYFQSCAMTDFSVDPYSVYPFEAENVNSLPNALGIQLYIGNGDVSKAKFKFKNLNVEAVLFSTVGLNTSTLEMSNSKLRKLDFRGSKIKLTDVDFEGNATHTYAIWDSVVDTIGGPVGLSASGCTFKGYERVLRSITSGTAQYSFVNASFEDITQHLFYSAGGTIPGNVSLVNAVLKNVAAYSNATNHPHFQHERTRALGTSPALPLIGSAVFNPSSLADGTGETTTLTVNGAALGDYVQSVSFSNDLQGITVTAWVSAANTVSVRFQNETGTTIDLASGTVRVVAKKY